MKTSTFNIGITKRTSVIHYVFCYFIAQLLMEIKKNTINDILLDLIKKFMETQNIKEKYRNYYINLINTSIDFIIILIVIFIFFTRKKMNKRKYKRKLNNIKLKRNTQRNTQIKNK